MIAEEQNAASRPGGFEEVSEEDERRGSIVFLAVVRCALLLAAGLLTGAIFGAWLVEHAFRGDGSFYTELKQLEISALTVPLSSLGAAAVALGLIHLFLVRGDRLAAGLTSAGVVCFVVGFAITLWIHFPINAQVMGWSAGAPPADWARVAAKWGRAHDLRTLSSVLGFCLLSAGAVLPARGRRPVKQRGGASRPEPVGGGNHRDSRSRGLTARAPQQSQGSGGKGVRR